jgi:hypothetical protein
MDAKDMATHYLNWTDGTWCDEARQARQHQDWRDVFWQGTT